MATFCFLLFDLLRIDPDADDFLLGMVGARVFEEIENLFGSESGGFTDSMPVWVAPLVPDLHAEGVTVDEVSRNAPCGGVDVAHVDGDR